MLFIAYDDKSKLIDVETQTVQRTYTTARIERRGLTYCPSSHVVFAHQSKGCVASFSPATQQPVKRSFAPDTVTSSLCSADGVFQFAGTADGNLLVWNVLSGQLLSIVRAHTRRVTDIAMPSDQSLVLTSSEDSVCKTWLVSTLVSCQVKHANPHCVFNGHTLAVNACTFMETGHVVATASSDRSCRIYDALTGQQFLVVTVDDILTAVRFSPGDDTLLIGSNKGLLYFVNIYPSSRGTPKLPTDLTAREDRVYDQKTFSGGHNAPIIFIWFDSARPEYAMVGSEDGVVLWWNVFSRRLHLEAVPRVASRVSSITFVPKDNRSPRWAPAILAKYPIDRSANNFTIVAVNDETKQIDMRKRRRASNGECVPDAESSEEQHIGRKMHSEKQNSQKEMVVALEAMRNKLERRLMKLIKS